MNEILDKIREIKEEIDSFYELSTRSKMESNQYLHIDGLLNELMGLCMSYAVKKEVEQ